VNKPSIYVSNQRILIGLAKINNQCKNKIRMGDLPDGGKGLHQQQHDVLSNLIKIQLFIILSF